MADYDPTARVTEEQLSLLKEQLTPVLRRMTRLQIFEMADFFYAQARERASQTKVDDWQLGIGV